jgi:glucose/arabinose dehydrogenase
MYNTDHTTRTLLISKKVPDMMLVSRGSASNIDNQAHDKNSGHSNIRAFNISGSPRSTPYTGGTLVGWGLRNSVGLAEHPIDGGE